MLKTVVPGADYVRSGPQPTPKPQSKGKLIAAVLVVVLLVTGAVLLMSWGGGEKTSHKVEPTRISGVMIAGGAYHTVGLKSNGTVVATGYNEDGRCDVGSWTDIAAVACEDRYTVGLKSDGTAVAVGFNGDNQCAVSNWAGLDLP